MMMSRISTDWTVIPLENLVARGADVIVRVADSEAARCYGTQEISERHRHRYEFNNEVREQFAASGAHQRAADQIEPPPEIPRQEPQGDAGGATGGSAAVGTDDQTTAHIDRLNHLLFGINNCRGGLVRIIQVSGDR